MMIGAVVHLVFHVVDGTADESTWKNDLIGVVAGIGLLAAGDAAVSSSKKEVADVKAAVLTGNTSILAKQDQEKQNGKT